MFLCPLDVDLTLGQVHRPWDLGDIIRSTVEEDRHGLDFGIRITVEWSKDRLDTR